jgi:hypothetical protein
MKNKWIIIIVVVIAVLLAAWCFLIRKKPTLGVTNSPISSPGAVEYTYSNFQPNQLVNIHVQGGGGVTNNADSSGGGSYNFLDTDAPGNYTLIAEDSYGHRATCGFKMQ